MAEGPAEGWGQGFVGQHEEPVWEEELGNAGVRLSFESTRYPDQPCQRSVEATPLLTPTPTAYWSRRGSVEAECQPSGFLDHLRC